MKKKSEVIQIRAEVYEIMKNEMDCKFCFEDICLCQGFNIKKLKFWKHYLNECPYISNNKQKECDMIDE